SAPHDPPSPHARLTHGDSRGGAPRGVPLLVSVTSPAVPSPVPRSPGCPARGRGQPRLSRTIPCWVACATRRPSRAYTLAVPSARPLLERGPSRSNSSQSSTWTGVCHHIAWSRLAIRSSSVYQGIPCTRRVGSSRL